MRILNDLHIGAIRSAGTTTVTQWALRQHILAQFKALLPTGEDLMILGDLFDTNNIPISDVLHTYVILSDWLRENPNNKLYNVNGNHDASKTSNILSSFQFLGALLRLGYPDRYVHIEESQAFDFGYVIPHYPNQDLFDLELAKVPECAYLFVHCNYDNGFAMNSDQSLNMSAEQVRNCKARKVVFAHEHWGKDLGKVHIPGNQIATSVSDWLAEKDKRFMSIVDGVHSYTVCAVRADNYAEMDYMDLRETNHKFIRVVGEADGEDATKVISAINKFRRGSSAFVITNAVNVRTADTNLVNFEASLNAVQGFSVMTALKNLFTEEEMKVLESLC